MLEKNSSDLKKLLITESIDMATLNYNDIKFLVSNEINKMKWLIDNYNNTFDNIFLNSFFIYLKNIVNACNELLNKYQSFLSTNDVEQYKKIYNLILHHKMPECIDDIKILQKQIEQINSLYSIQGPGSLNENISPVIPTEDLTDDEVLSSSMNKLKRDELVHITNDFKKNIDSYDAFDIPDNMYLDYMSKLQNALLSHSCIYDKRFVTYGRLDFLKEEFTKRLNDETLKIKKINFQNQDDNRLSAFWDLQDYITGDRHISMINVPSGIDFHQLVRLNNEYYKDGIICLQERDILLNMIREMQDYIHNKINNEMDKLINNIGKDNI